jgi:predicted secreted protein
MIRSLFILPFALLVFSCSQTQDITEASPFVNAVPLHSKFNITLPENHTTGYMWQIKNGYNDTVVDYMNSVWHGNEKGVVFNFESKAKGSAELEFKLIKYQDTMEIKKFWIQVK